MPPEVHPRRRPAHPLLRIIVAVLSGAAAMSAITAYQAKPPAAPAAAVALKPPPPRPKSPDLSMPRETRPTNVPPAPSSMLIKAEPGAAMKTPPRRLEGRLSPPHWSNARFQAITSKQSAQVTSLKSTPRLINKEILGRQDVFVPSELHPEFVPEEAFWTQERLLRVGSGAFLALLGILYIMMTAFPKKKSNEAA